MKKKTDYLTRGNDVAFNIDVYVKDRNLYVRFDILSNKEDNTHVLKLKNIGQVAAEYAADPLKPSDIKKDITEIMDKEILKHLLAMQNNKIDDKDPMAFTFYRRNKLGKFCSHIQITYKLSTIPHILINWITCFAIFVNQNLRKFHLQFGDHHAFGNIDKNTDINGLFSAKHSVHVILELMKKIVAFKSFEPELKRYKNALADLEKLYINYFEGRQLQNPKPLIQCVSDQNRCDILYKNQFKQISDSENPQQKTSSIVSLARSMVSKKYECLFMFELINAKNRLLFITPCLGKMSHEGDVYTMNFTELSLLYFAEFEYLPDGRMAIVNLDKNAAYLAYYAKGQRNFDIFHEEFYHWAKCMDLEIEPEHDFHTENAIIFTPQCTLKLANMDLHLNSRYCRNLFNVYNTWAFYTRIAMADNGFGKLAKETLDQIILETNPSFKKLCNTHHQGFFHAVQMGKERGQKEYAGVMEREMQAGLI